MPLVWTPPKGCVWRCVPGPPPYDTAVCRKVCPTIVANPFPKPQSSVSPNTRFTQWGPTLVMAAPPVLFGLLGLQPATPYPSGGIVPPPPFGP